MKQLDDRRLHWKAEIGPSEREWDAEITEQVPDRLIEWRAIGDVTNDGRVTFTEMGPNQTKVSVVFEFDPEGFVEKAGDTLGIVDKRVEGDLERFRDFIEERPIETGAWRGEIR